MQYARLLTFMYQNCNICIFTSVGGMKIDKRIILFPILAIVIFSIVMLFVYNIGKFKRLYFSIKFH